MIMAISARVSPAFKLLKLLFTLAPRNSYLQCPNNRCIIFILYYQYTSVDYIYLSIAYIYIYLPTLSIREGALMAQVPLFFNLASSIAFSSLDDMATAALTGSECRPHDTATSIMGRSSDKRTIGRRAR